MKHWQIPLITFAALFVSLALAEDFKTTNGKEYKNATVTLVEPDGITLRSKSGVSKVYFNELPKDVQERFHYAVPASPEKSTSGAIDSQRSAALMLQAESALRSGQFSQGAELLNQIVSEYPKSRQAQTVYDLRAILREKQQTQSGPLTADEAQTFRSSMDTLANIKRNYRTTTPDKRRALEAVMGAETFQDTDNSLDAVSRSLRKLQESREEALQGN